MIPAGKPRLSTAELEAMLAPLDIDRSRYPVIVVGIRAYYQDTMGAPSVNDRGIYDDAIFLHTPSVTAAFNGNTDPSRYKKGSGTGSAKGMASLDPGVWYAHRFDKHNGKYLALCQRVAEVTVTRDGDPPYQDTGMFGINIHKGGYNTTSSLGCQTIHPDQWESFISMAADQAKRYFGARWAQSVVPYVLLAPTPGAATRGRSRRESIPELAAVWGYPSENGRPRPTPARTPARSGRRSPAPTVRTRGGRKRSTRKAPA
jgi:lysozyme